MEDYVLVKEVKEADVPKKRVYYPDDPFLRSTIDRVAQLVAKYGSAIEKVNWKK